MDRATLGNWAGRACFHFKHVASYMRGHLAGADGLFMDETTALIEVGNRASCSAMKAKMEL